MCKFVGPQKLMWHNIMKSTKIKKTLVLHIVLVANPCDARKSY